MNRQKWILLAAVFVCVGTAAGFLARMRTHQKLGEPGVRLGAVPDTNHQDVALPEKVPGYTSKPIPIEQLVLDMLPKDTRFGQRRYTAEDGFEVQVNVVLMGGDRTSLHKPQFCLRGTGWIIQKTESAVVPMTRPMAYDLPVKKLTVAPEKSLETGPVSGIYVYWFVADRQQTPEHWQRMWWMARDLLATGVLERWAYITYFAVCPPGRENEAFERVQKLIAESAPEFVTYPRSVTAAAR